MEEVQGVAMGVFGGLAARRHFAHKLKEVVKGFDDDGLLKSTAQSMLPPRGTDIRTS